MQQHPEQDGPEDQSDASLDALLPTLEETPPPPEPMPSCAASSSSGVEASTSRPTRNRKPAKPRAALHAAIVSDKAYDEDLPTIHAAFAAGITIQNGQYHDSLPDAPKNWKQMLAHPEHAGFEAAA
jgi:hypothetical protein